jgi:hypothetical protein
MKKYKVMITLGTLAAFSLLATISFALIRKIFTDWFIYHRFFAFLTLTLAFAHALMSIIIRIKK